MLRCVLSAMLLATVSVSLAGQTIKDDFAGETLNSSLWQSFTQGSATVAQSGGRVVATVAPATGGSSAGFALANPVSGDFDAEVDYAILNWPLVAPPVLGLQINFDPMDAAYEVARGWGNYLTNLSGYQAGPATNDMSGRLRLMRRGATFSAFYYDPAAGWRLLRSTGEGNLTKTALLSFNLYGNTSASVAFDNVSITFGSEAHVVSAASYISGASQTAEAIVSIFGQNLAESVMVAPADQSLPVSLGGISVVVTDSTGTERTAPLWFVSPAQINLQVPPGTAAGLATVSVKNQGQTVATGVLRIEAVAPSLFSANSTGAGVAAAIAVWARSDGSQEWGYVFQCGSGAGTCVPVPLAPTTASETLFLLLYGTGIRGRSSLEAVSATIGGVEVPVEYAGPVAGLIGLDQVNLRLPPSLAGKGEAGIVIVVDGKASNTVTVNLR